MRRVSFAPQGQDRCPISAPFDLLVRELEENESFVGIATPELVVELSNRVCYCTDSDHRRPTQAGVVLFRQWGEWHRKTYHSHDNCLIPVRSERKPVVPFTSIPEDSSMANWDAVGGYAVDCAVGEGFCWRFDNRSRLAVVRLPEDAFGLLYDYRMQDKRNRYYQDDTWLWLQEQGVEWCPPSDSQQLYDQLRELTGNCYPPKLTCKRCGKDTIARSGICTKCQQEIKKAGG